MVAGRYWHGIKVDNSHGLRRSAKKIFGTIADKTLTRFVRTAPLDHSLATAAGQQTIFGRLLPIFAH